MILIDDDPIADMTILQDHARLPYIMKDGRFHEEPGDQDAPLPDMDELVTSSTQQVVTHRP